MLQLTCWMNFTHCCLDFLVCHKDGLPGYDLILLSGEPVYPCSVNFDISSGCELFLSRARIIAPNYCGQSNFLVFPDSCFVPSVGLIFIPYLCSASFGLCPVQ